MIVVDANIIVHAVVASDKTPLAKSVAQCDANWLVPTLWRYEVLNVLATLARNQRIASDDAQTALHNAELLAAPGERSVDQSIVLRTALQLGISGYDAQYIALARLFGVRCVTADAALTRKASGIAIGLEEFIAGA